MSEAWIVLYPSQISQRGESISSYKQIFKKAPSALFIIVHDSVLLWPPRFRSLEPLPALRRRCSPPVCSWPLTYGQAQSRNTHPFIFAQTASNNPLCCLCESAHFFRVGGITHSCVREFRPRFIAVQLAAVARNGPQCSAVRRLAFCIPNQTRRA